MFTLRRGLSVVGTLIGRNRGLRWFAIVFVVLFILALAPTPVRKRLWHFYDGLFDREVSASGTSFGSDIEKVRPDSKIIRFVMELYIQMRVEGHTQKYARAVIESVRAKPSIGHDWKSPSELNPHILYD